MNNNQRAEKFEAALASLRRAIAAAREKSILGLHYSRTQLEIIFLLNKLPGQTTGELAKRLFLTSGAVTQTVETLVQRGVMSRTADSKDRRIIRLNLTPTGLEVATDMHAARHKRIASLISKMSPAEAEALISSTERLAQLIQEGINNTTNER
ncbi:MAG TPA: MarR family transcriptional regulator [Candidatus Polarisedimenticolaceae bacterium]|nr:MarR family transcriptional regulator [Candidatus Polarisedimenticolaceae bacterium]